MGKNTQTESTSTGRVLGSKISREISAGGAVYRKFQITDSKLQIKWLVAGSAPSKLYPEVVWRLPKGWIDNDSPDTPGPVSSGRVKASEGGLQQGALREVKEEGGVEAKIVKKIGTSKFFYQNHSRGRVLKFVTFYLMEWVCDFPEGFDDETSEVVWLPYDKAYKKLSFSGEKAILKKAKESLEQGTQENLPL